MKETSEDGDRCLHEGLEELDRGHGVGHGAPVSGELLEAGAGNKESRVGKSEFQLEADLLRHQVPTFITSCKCCHLVANWGPLPEVEASDALPVPDGKILFFLMGSPRGQQAPFWNLCCVYLHFCGFQT